MKFTGKGSSERLRRQRGLTLIESALVLTIAALSMVFFVRMLSDNAEVMKAKGVSEKMVEVFDAASKYVKVNNATLISQIPSGSLIVIPVGRPDASSPIPAGPATNLPSLQGGGYLSPGYIDRNSYNQRHALIVRNVNVSGIGQRLDAIITSYGGMKIPDRQLMKISGFVGAAGGYVPKTPLPADAGQIVGSYGGWRSPLSAWGSTNNPAQGSIVATLAFEAGENGIAPYLYRMNIGKPEANRMQTSIDVNNWDLNNVRKVTAGSTGTVNVTGNIEATGNVVADVDIWAKRNVHADGNVEANVDVNAGRDVNAGHDVNAINKVKAPTVQGTAIVTSPIVEASGNAGQINAVGNNASINALGTNGTVNTTRLRAKVIDAAGTMITGVHNGGGGVLLSALFPKQVPMYSYLARHGNWVPKPSCQAGAVPRIMLYRQQDAARIAVTPSGGWTMFADVINAVYAVDGGWGWVVYWGGMISSIAPSTAIAQTFCVYD